MPVSEIIMPKLEVLAVNLCLDASIQNAAYMFLNQASASRNYNY